SQGIGRDVLDQTYRCLVVEHCILGREIGGVEKREWERLLPQGLFLNAKQKRHQTFEQGNKGSRVRLCFMCCSMCCSRCVSFRICHRTSPQVLHAHAISGRRPLVRAAAHILTVWIR